MATETDWLDDVRRWYFGGTPPAADLADGSEPADPAVGYEAAHPSLVARHWPDAPAPEPQISTTAALPISAAG